MMKKTALRRGRKVAAIIGFGSQGRAHALRLFRSGWTVRVGLPTGSKSRRSARAHGFPTALPHRAVSGADVVAMLVPDQIGSRLINELGPRLAPGALVVFAAGYPLVFPQAPPPPHCDVVMVAPHGPGRDLAAGVRVSGFVAVHQDKSGTALERAHAYARAIGLDRLYVTTARDEALGDLFGEQALLCGGLVGLTAAVADTMVTRGLAPENAYFETIAQLRNLSGLLESAGVEGFWREISDCAAAGMAQASSRLFDAGFQARLHRLWEEIESGAFARHFQRHGRPSRQPEIWQILKRLEVAAKKKGGRRRPPQNP